VQEEEAKTAQKIVFKRTIYEISSRLRRWPFLASRRRQWSFVASKDAETHSYEKIDTEKEEDWTVIMSVLVLL
jgi:hypothetical protein